MPSRAYTSLLHGTITRTMISRRCCVNALTGLYLIATNKNWEYVSMVHIRCQCPHGLIPHCYPIKPKFELATVASVNALTGLYLIATLKQAGFTTSEMAACQCPHGLIPHCYLSKKVKETFIYNHVSMPSRAYTSLLLCCT